MNDTSVSSTLLKTNRLVAGLLRFGLPMGPLRILETIGRTSGLTRTTAVVLTTRQGDSWLVSPFGDTDWVRNVRTSPNAHLVHRRQRRPIHVTEVDHYTAAPVLQTFLRRYRRVPFVPPAFTADVSSDLTHFLAEAHLHPVFRISHLTDPRAIRASRFSAARHRAPIRERVRWDGQEREMTRT